MTQNDGEVQEAHCDRCGTLGKHLVCITANREGGVENWKPICSDCLEELGQWFKQETELIE